MDLKHSGTWRGIPRCALPSVHYCLSRARSSILIVEDEALVRISGVGLFVDAGFRAIEAVNSDEALEILNAGWEKFTRLVARFFPPIRTLHPLPCHRFDARTRGRSPVRYQRTPGSSEVQVLFTDVNLPGMIDGLALARPVNDRWPHIGIIIVSGRSTPQPHELRAGSRFHRKPYDSELVVRHAREMTAAKRPPPSERLEASLQKWHG
jgi:two-component system, response regulator PdtaR